MQSRPLAGWPLVLCCAVCICAWDRTWAAGASLTRASPRCSEGWVQLGAKAGWHSRLPQLRGLQRFPQLLVARSRGSVGCAPPSRVATPVRCRPNLAAPTATQPPGVGCAALRKSDRQWQEADARGVTWLPAAVSDSMAGGERGFYKASARGRRQCTKPVCVQVLPSCSCGGAAAMPCDRPAILRLVSPPVADVSRRRVDGPSGVPPGDVPHCRPLRLPASSCPAGCVVERPQCRATVRQSSVLSLVLSRMSVGAALAVHPAWPRHMGFFFRPPGPGGREGGARVGELVVPNPRPPEQTHKGSVLDSQYIGARGSAGRVCEGGGHTNRVCRPVSALMTRR